jgi:hypothetical protein
VKKKTRRIKLRTKLLVPHCDDCTAQRYTRAHVWPTPWAYFGDSEYRDSIGRTTKDYRGERWIRLGCNDISCPALIVVAEVDLLTMLPRA